MIRRRCFAAAVDLFGAVLLVGCASTTPSPGPASTPETIRLEMVNDQPVTLAAALGSFLSTHEGHGALVRGEPAVRELCGRIAERLLFLAEAHALGIDAEQDIVLAGEEHRRELASKLYWKREVDDQVHVTDEEIERFYAKTDVALRVSLIKSKDRASADALRARVVAGEDFGDLARAESIDASRSFGGLLPWTRRGELDPALESTVFDLTQPGALTPVIATADGFAFVRLEERAENANRPPRDVALTQIRNVLENRARQARGDEVLARVRADAHITRSDELLTRARVLAETDPDSVVATAGDERLTMKEFRELLNREALQAATDEQAAKAIAAIAQQWADGPALEQAAAGAGLLADPGIEKQVGAYREEVTLGRLLERYVYADVNVGEDQVRAYYDQHVDEFTRPTELHLAHIMTATEAEANAILERLRAGEDFAALARSCSIDKTSAMHSGKVGWVKKGDILPEIDARAFDQPVGVVDGPIKTDAGYHLVKVLERKESMLVPYDSARRAAEKRALKIARTEAYATWAKRIKARAQIVLDEAGIQQAVAYLDREAERAAGQDRKKSSSPHQAPDGTSTGPGGAGAVSEAAPPSPNP